jgi:hypothetical protein
MKTIVFLCGLLLISAGNRAFSAQKTIVLGRENHCFSSGEQPKRIDYGESPQDSPLSLIPD